MSTVVLVVIAGDLLYTWRTGGQLSLVGIVALVVVAGALL
jgi:hypothetical protein